MADEVEYTPLRHARVSDHPDVVWVVIARWRFPEGKTEWALEYWGERHEAGSDAFFDDESGAMALAAREFGIAEEDWRDGPEPSGRVK